ncbi:Cupredoxin [Artemisia annua]|uniref:Cupredoxin n=1 Tax=Artemisia annua TaxID=35608 RepID=A0A2U1MMD6_ARTAN|nr:Cupredoxin [Artemisia annua]
MGQKSPFQIGDVILFMYEAGKDSTSPLQSIVIHGHSVVKLTHSGTYYFISGIVDYCKNNEKTEMIVMAYRCNKLLPASPPPSTDQTWNDYSRSEKIIVIVGSVIIIICSCLACLLRLVG